MSVSMLLIPVMRMLLLGKTVLPGKQPLLHNKAFIDLISSSPKQLIRTQLGLLQSVRTAQMKLNGAAITDIPGELACHPTSVG